MTKAALRGCRPGDRGLLLGNADSFDVAVSAACVERARTRVRHALEAHLTGSR